MPKPSGAKTGQDYSRTKQTLARTAAQQKDNPLYQAVSDLVNGAVDFQGFIDNQFPQLDGSLSSLYNAVVGLVNELAFIRNNSKFSVSLLNLTPQVATSGPVTFDTVLYNDGLIFNPLFPDRLIANANAEYLISGTIGGISASPGEGTLLQDFKVAGIDEGSSFIIFLKNDNTFTQFNLPGGFSILNDGDIAISLTYSRIFVPAQDGSPALLVFDGDGVLINTIRIPTIDAGAELGQGLYSFNDRLWVAIYGATEGQIWEFDINGVFIQIIAKLIDATATGYLSAAQGMNKFSHYIYFINDDISPPMSAAANGVYRYDLVLGGNSTRIVSTGTDQVYGFAQDPQTGMFLTTIQSDTITRYSAAGISQQTYTNSGSQFEGLAYSNISRYFYVGDDNPEKVWRVDLFDGFFLGIHTTPAMDRALSIGSIDCCDNSINNGLKVQVSINGIPQFSTNSDTFAGLIDVLRNDVITVEVLGNGNIQPTLQLHRVSYVQHDKASGRNIK